MYSERVLLSGEALWRSEGSVGGAVVPADGCVDLILRDGRVEVAGPSTRWLATGPDGAAGSFGFRMQPGRAGLLLGLDLAAIADQLVPLDDVADRRTAARLREAMTPLEAGPAPIGTLAAFSAQLAEASPWSDAVRRSASEATSARDVAATLSGSERSFRRRMLATFGYGYATLVRLDRAHRARSSLRSGSSIADVAASAGYADQPHLSREFRRLVGSSPAQFAASAA
ncbi:transcriptional regulator, AraC family [Plantibacter flavus]|uniref:AraC family transcriptional regulator n=1 Tax=Plantibacter flavus TaxID=150123 RepID=A0A3N2C7Z8_9MICO|nr:helix-turn-helix transcriptional regulator [Plantibacter flavus]ROR83434.1 AraC family transcriptional regulator [Plantibacter flavus]SMG23416.1 transcriptional regulator, AraC family [Plantibacter flavus]